MFKIFQFKYIFCVLTSTVTYCLQNQSLFGYVFVYRTHHEPLKIENHTHTQTLSITDEAGICFIFRITYLFLFFSDFVITPNMKTKLNPYY